MLGNSAATSPAWVPSGLSSISSTEGGLPADTPLVSSIVTTAELGLPSVAPPVAPLRVTLTVRFVVPAAAS